MMGDARDIARMLGKKANPKVPTRVRATVTKVEPSRTWVRINGSSGETPCASTSASVKPGDAVSVLITGNRATIEGNYTSPATDDSKAEEAIKTGSSAQQTADMAHELATNAIADAQATRDAAERAEADAARAADAADSAAVSAANSERFAASSEESATIAKAASTSAVRDALSANVAANGAISSLGTVQDIMGTLEWMQRNRMFVAAQSPFDTTIRYYHVIGDEYVAVENPLACDLGDYYEIRPPYHAPTYDDAPVEGKTYYELLPARYEAVAEPNAEDMDSYAEIVGGVYAKTQDTEPVEGKTYYVLVPSRFEAVDSPGETDGLYEVRPGGYVLTDDESIVAGKQYYSLGQGTYAVVTSPTAKDLATYFELSGGLYVPTRDAQVDSAKTYYRLDSGSYAPVRRANAERLVTYLTIDPKSTMADFMESHLALSQRGLYITQSKAIVNADGTIAFPPGQASYYMLLGHDGMVLFDALGHEVAHYGESAGQDGMWSATSMEASMFAIQRKVEMPDGSIAKEDVFRVGITDDGQQVLHFMLPVPISEGGTGARNEGDAADNLLVQSIGCGTELTPTEAVGSVDLNSIKTPGNYVAGRSSWVASMANKPAKLNSAFRLTVWKVLGNTPGSMNNSIIAQVIREYNTGREFYRVNGGSGWTAWVCGVRDNDVIDIPHGGHGSTTVAGARANLAVPGYVEAGAHWRVTEPDGTYDKWMRVPTPGIIPAEADTTNKTGKGSLGSGSWYFASAYVVNYYGNWAGNTIPVDKGGSGITSNPSMLVNLGSTSAASVFQTSPRPGVTGILPLSNGGLGSNTAAGGRSTLGLTYEGVYGAVTCANASSYYTDGKNLSVCRRGTCAIINMNGLTIHGGMTNNRTTVATVPSGYRPAASCYVWPVLIETGGAVKIDFDSYSSDQTFWDTITYPVG